MAAVQPGSARPLGRVALPDPVYPIWRWLTTVRNAIQLIALLTLFALAGVIIPQVPPQLLDSPAAVAQHVDNQRPTFDHVPAATILLPLAAFLVWLAVRRLAPLRRRDSVPSRLPLGPRPRRRWPPRRSHDRRPGRRRRPRPDRPPRRLPLALRHQRRRLQPLQSALPVRPHRRPCLRHYHLHNQPLPAHLAQRALAPAPRQRPLL